MVISVVDFVVCIVWLTRNQRLTTETRLRWEEMAGEEVLVVDGTVIAEEGKQVVEMEKVRRRGMGWMRMGL